MYFNQIQISPQGSIGCQNSAQPEPACANFDFTNTWGPVCCNDYRVDFCCLPEGMYLNCFLDDYVLHTNILTEYEIKGIIDVPDTNLKLNCFFTATTTTTSSTISTTTNTSKKFYN